MVKSKKEAVHICYCHTPTRWIWRFDDYAAREKFSPLVKSALRKMVSMFKFLDRVASRNPDFFLANSTTVADRIRQFYGRESLILFPPIECKRFVVSHQEGDYYLIVSRLQAYKRIDLAIEACERLGKRLIVIGDGPDRKRLEALSGANTQFLGRLSDAEVNRYMAGCRAFLFPGEEDFGMTPLEANAAGKPCVAFAGGGAFDTVIDGVTGILFKKPTSESLADSLLKLENTRWNPEMLRRHAEKFDTRIFSEKFVQLVSDLAYRKLSQSSTNAEI
jgi:glycosyltransferase involved in cell wall biosynthesis